MKVWVLRTEGGNGDVFLYAETVDILSVPYIKSELGNHDGGYEDERDEFISDVENALRRGRGTAVIEDRFTLELQGVSL